jgi:hypothetical protein
MLTTKEDIARVVKSDIDIALLFSQPSDALRLLDMQEDLTALLGRQAGLVNPNQVSPILGMQVLLNCEIVFERSSRAAREFQVRTMFAYFDLKQVRKPIEEAALQISYGGSRYSSGQNCIHSKAPRPHSGSHRHGCICL